MSAVFCPPGKEFPRAGKAGAKACRLGPGTGRIGAGPDLLPPGRCAKFEKVTTFQNAGRPPARERPFRALRGGFVPCFFFLAAAFSAVSAGALQETAPTAGSSDEVRIIARDWEKTKDRVFAVGSVEIHYRDVTLFADRVEVDPKTKDVVAEGSVVVHLPRENIRADKIFINLDTTEFKMDNAQGMVQPTIFYEARSVEKKEQNFYNLGKAWLTSCAQPTPRWAFSVGRANFKKDDYVEMWNAVFRIKKVPLFYLPYMRYPLNQDRSTGFLMPQIGYSGAKGYIYSQNFHWVIARNMDATFDFDYYSSRGVGGGLEYRYLFQKGTGGRLNLYYFNFKKDESGQKPDDAYIIRFHHNQPLPLGFSLVAAVDYQSSQDFLREFDNNFRRAVVSNRSSQVYLSRSWSSFNLSMRTSQFETYFNQAGFEGSIISRYLPQINFSCFRVKLFSPFYFSFNSSFNNWQYGWRGQYETNSQKKSSNLSFSPTLTMPFNPVPWLTTNASLTANFTYYGQSYPPNTRERILNEPILLRGLGVNLEMTGPVFFKIYRDGEGDPKLKHIIEPYVSYSYDSPLNARTTRRIITASGYFYRYHQLSYGLTNRLLFKIDDMPREVISVGIGQTYYFSPEDSPMSIYLFKDKIPRFSEIDGYVRFYPAARYSLDFAAGFNPYFKQVSSLRLGANFGRAGDPFFFNLSWFKSMNPWFTDILFDRHQVSAWGGFKVPKMPLEAFVDVDFNIAEKKLLYSGASLIYHYQCLDFSAEVKVFYFRSVPETQVKFSIGLGNIGKTTDFLGGFGFNQ